MSNQAYNNATEYQEKMRREMCERVESAIIRMRKDGLRVTKRSISEEVGCHENTLRLPYMKAFLSKFEEFQVQEKCAQLPSIDEAMNRIKQLEEDLEHSRHNNRILREKLTTVCSERDSFEGRYRRLLGKYQTVTGKKTIGF